MSRAIVATLARLAIATVVVALAMPAVADDAAAWTNGPCPTASGVTVVVDFQELGGGVHVRCAPGAVSSGFHALQQAGIDYQTTVRFPGFLCKIAGQPANDPCVNTSPASAYWGYWVAPRGGQWCYSNWGAGNRTPPQGTVEGWSFSLNKTASTSPQPRAAVPGPVAGAPRTLPASDCDQRRSAPTPQPAPRPPATTAPRPSPAPPPAAAPRSPAPAPGSHANAPDRDPGAPVEPGADPAPGGGGEAGTSERPGSLSTAPETTDDEVRPEEVTEEDASGAEERDNSGTDDTTKTPAGATTSRAASEGSASEESAGGIDLGGDEDSGSPIPLVVTAAVLAALGLVAVLVRRRGSAG